ncbi:catalytic phage domain protein : Integrase, catalytic core, phage domain protein OS=Rhodopirellula sallentina SM41 GN=RSSM_06627 PE=4 SV=1: Phage_integrase [Gemmataceae bacterium]|nr:catalytic phage domain protein : Integrase, catalytic core, phage domain protein OS=Rhodopirellula sallentina SM41 GN=RSSM_06627 PE=4 SV=1: Phage_integrase [Gemmataceae bacterium]VTT98771.1 catalytic phage domain protein : Integrase, catalytic core, phage domain protein OS=Rhodopirellula sallentina SM41 GN=RSSM_06627 PE=4 SV=1: Phage_integrase [Gemmataceae bacterium]
MARHRNSAPSYVLHQQSGRGRLGWTDSLGIRHQKLLPGPFGSTESLAAKARLELELATSPVPAQVDPKTLTVAEVLIAYLDFAEQHYRDPQGQPTDEVRHLKATIRYVRELYGDALATEFGPLALKAVRQKFVEQEWCRKTVNARVERIRRIFKWAVAEELIPPSVYQALAAVSGLQRGRTPARESEPVGPVDDAVVDATIAHLNRHVRGLVEFQRLTGCRPGEACRLRRCDIDMSGSVWLYKPASHKTAWKGKSRTVAIGPKAQELLREFFTPEIEDFLFSPRRAVEEQIAARTANRNTPRYPSHMKRNEMKRVGAKRKRAPAERYNRLGYLRAITRACDQAFELPPVLAPRRNDDGKTESRREWWARLDEEQKGKVKQWRAEHHWHPNQLRHSYATKVRKAHGLEAAQVLLGHSRADVTQVYAERNEELAVSVAAKIG